MNIPEEIYRVYTLLNEGEEEKAWQKIAKWEKSEHLTPEENHIYKMLKGIILRLTGRLQESLKIAEELYQESKNQNNTVDSIDALTLRCSNLLILHRFAEVGESIMLCETMLKSVLQESFGLEIEWRKAMIWLMKGFYLSHLNEFDNALKHLNKSLTIIKKYDILSVFLPLNLEGLGYVYTGKGELDIALKFHKESLGHSRGEYMEIKITNAISYHSIGEIYFQKGDLDLAIEYYEKSLKIWEQFTFPMALDWVGIDYDSLIKVFLYKDSPERAQEYLDQLLDYLKKRKKNENSYHYRLGKVRILASSSRTRDQAEAEKDLKEFIAHHDALIKSGAISMPIRYGAGIWYLLICDIYLKELRLTNNLTILNEIKPFITRLLKESERANSYTLQVQTYLLHGKISLLELNIVEARRYLTQAQRIAERHGLNKLAIEISHEHKSLIDCLELWEQLKVSEAPLSERFELAQISEQMKRMHRNLVVATQIIEEKVTISKEKKICLVCKGEVFGFSYICKCGANYCEHCARALSNLENVCWACDVPIDFSKPSKPYKEEEAERIDIQEKAKKK